MSWTWILRRGFETYVLIWPLVAIIFVPLVAIGWHIPVIRRWMERKADENKIVG